jgi:hypothetical protein
VDYFSTNRHNHEFYAFRGDGANSFDCFSVWGCFFIIIIISWRLSIFIPNIFFYFSSKNYCWSRFFVLLVSQYKKILTISLVINFWSFQKFAKISIRSVRQEFFDSI